MNINTTDGSITFASGSIFPRDGLDQFVQRMADASPRQTFENGEWRHFDADPEPEVKITAFLRGERIDRVFISMSLPMDEAGQWTVEHELERKSRHDTWLRSALGEPPYEYRWGRVVSFFDAKSCASEIIVSYAS